MEECIQKKSEISKHASKACIFCKIVKGEISCSKVYEDEKCLAFLDIAPVNRGHTLVISKEHHETMEKLPDDLLRYLIYIVKKV